MLHVLLYHTAAVVLYNFPFVSVGVVLLVRHLQILQRLFQQLYNVNMENYLTAQNMDIQFSLPCSQEPSTSLS